MTQPQKIGLQFAETCFRRLVPRNDHEVTALIDHISMLDEDRPEAAPDQVSDHCFPGRSSRGNQSDFQMP